MRSLGQTWFPIHHRAVFMLECHLRVGGHGWWWFINGVIVRMPASPRQTDISAPSWSRDNENLSCHLLICFSEHWLGGCLQTSSSNCPWLLLRVPSYQLRSSYDKHCRKSISFWNEWEAVKALGTKDRNNLSSISPCFCGCPETLLIVFLVCFQRFPYLRLCQLWH